MSPGELFIELESIKYNWRVVTCTNNFHGKEFSSNMTGYCCPSAPSPPRAYVPPGRLSELPEGEWYLLIIIWEIGMGSQVKTGSAEGK